MKLYLAVSYLPRQEWASNTVSSWARNGFELCVRRYVKNESGDMIAAHTSLFFQNVTRDLQENARAFLRADYTDATSFFVDILSDGKHVVSVWDDDDSWHKRWSSIRVELHEVLDVDEAAIQRAFDAVIRHVDEQTSYDMFQNCNMLWEFYPCRCSATCGICCPCASGVNCISATLEGLAATRGGYEWNAERVLGLRPRTSLGARLPRDALEELIESRAVNAESRRLLHAKQVDTPSAYVPLLLLRF